MSQDIITSVSQVINEFTRNATSNTSKLRLQYDIATGNSLTFSRHGLKKITRGKPKTIYLIPKCCQSLNSVQKVEFWEKKTAEIYYSLTITDNQAKLNADIASLAKLLRVPRRKLGIVASPRGFICGPVQISSKVINDRYDFLIHQNLGQSIDCTQSPVSISETLANETDMYAIGSAKRILVVEKEAVFQRLVSDRMHARLNAIIVTGQGFPSFGCQLFLSKLERQLRIPVMGLFDCNPYGLLIFEIYRHPREMIDGKGYMVDMKWLGLSIHDLTLLNIPAQQFKDLTRKDLSILEYLEKKNDIGTDEKRKKAIRDLRIYRKKLEIESLNSVYFEYLCDVYLPRKIKEVEMQQE